MALTVPGEFKNTMEEMYGVYLTAYGEGNVVAWGHVDEIRFLAAANRYYREIFGVSTDFETLEDAVGCINYTYVYLVDRDGDWEWWLMPCEASHPNAFPVTIWDVE